MRVKGLGLMVIGEGSRVVGVGRQKGGVWNFFLSDRTGQLT